MTIDEPPYDPERDGPPPPDTGRHLHSVHPTTDTRTPPHDPAAEQAVLGALILDPGLTPTATLELDRSDFYDLRHQVIWDAICHITNKLTGDLRLDATMLADHLATQPHGRRGNELTYIGGAPYLAACTDACPIPSNLPYYATKVRDTARLRTIHELAAGLTQLTATTDVDQLEHAFTVAYDKLDTAAARIGPSTTTGPITGFRDLSWILTGQAPEIPPPAWVRHEAGHAIFYGGKVNGIFGDPETAKSWLAQCAIVEALNAGGTAAMIDVDHNGEDHTAARLLLLGANIAHLADPDKFRYYDPQEADELRNAVTEITTLAPTVVLIDSLGEVFPMLGLNTNDGDEITGGLRLISQPAKAGSCVIFIDHLPKSPEARTTGFAIGSIAKKRAIRGSYIRAEERTKPAPGQVGRISLFIEKDTAGQLRKATPGGKYVGTFTLDSTQPHVTTWSIGREGSPITEDGIFRPTHLMEAISRFIEDNDACTTRDIREAIDSRPKNIQAAVERLVTEGFVSRIPGRNNAKLHHSIAHYRETEDDNT